MHLPAAWPAALTVHPTRTADPSPSSTASRSLQRIAPIALPLAVGGLAFSIRWGVLLRGGGLTGIGGYDDGVYYAAGAALVHGRLPYADFLFLHPPGVVLATAPFAVLGGATSDAAGFVAARIAFELIGALNAALVVLVLRRFGRVAPVVGGVLYAVLLPAVWVERSVLLEPLGTLGVLLALLLLQRDRSRWWVVAAGIAAGWAADVKIWYVVPVLVIAALGTAHRARFLIGALGAIAAVWLPFLALAPAAMIREVVIDQLGRPREIGLMRRVAGILDAHAVGPLDLRSITVALALLAATALVIAMRTRGAAVFGALLAADMAVLLTAPSYFEHYGSLAAPALALCAGVAVQRIAERLLPRRPAATVFAVAMTALVLAAGLHVADRTRSGVAVPAAFTRAVDRSPGCITSDDPTMLVVSDVLSRDLADRRCTVWPDVTGWTYDRADLRNADGGPVPRARNAVWQRLVLGYLRSGDATVLVRPTAGLSSRTRSELDAVAPLDRDGRYVLRPIDHA